MSKRVCDGEPQSIVGREGELMRPTGLESEAVADEHERDVFVGVAVSFAQLIGPKDGSVIEHRARSIGLRNGVELPGKQRDLFAEPVINSYQFVLRRLVEVRIVRKGMMSFVNPQPPHPGLAYRIGELNGCDARHVVRKGVDQEIRL